MSLTLINLEQLINEHHDKLDNSIDEINLAVEAVVEHSYKAACIEHANMTQTEANQAWLNYKATL